MEIQNTDKIFIINNSNLKHKFSIVYDGNNIYFITEGGEYLSGTSTLTKTKHNFSILDLDGNSVNIIREDVDYMIVSPDGIINARFKIDNSTPIVTTPLIQEQREQPKTVPPEPNVPTLPPKLNIPNRINVTNIEVGISPLIWIIIISLGIFVIVLVLIFMFILLRKSD